jgi:ribose-phosphate pyrophosphokinase
MIDDLTTTAGTLCCAADVLHGHGARCVYAAVSHALLTPEALERIKASPIREMLVTDSVPMINADGFPVKTLSVASLLAEAILRIHENRSVSTLFRW